VNSCRVYRVNPWYEAEVFSGISLRFPCFRPAMLHGVKVDDQSLLACRTRPFYDSHLDETAAASASGAVADAEGKKTSPVVVPVTANRLFPQPQDQIHTVKEQKADATLEGECEVEVMPNESHRIYSGQRVVVRIRLVG
jgi:carbonic anhydrase/acetyltransferase-like protein (isoleucine patch superfamily)